MAACGDSKPPIGEIIEEAFLCSYHTYLQVPLSALRGSTLEEFSSRMDHKIVNVPDWKYMAEWLGFANHEILCFENKRHKAAEVVQVWITRSATPPTLGDLLNVVHAIVGRKDIFTDEILQQKIIRDAQLYQNRQLPMTASFSWHPGFQDSIVTSTTSHTFHPSSFSGFSSRTITRSNSTNTPQQYPDTTTPSFSPHRLPTPSADEVSFDVYLFYRRVDGFIRDELIPRLNTERIKYCLPDNLPIGQDAHETSMHYMLHRSAKILVLLSDEVLQTRQAQTLATISQRFGFEPGRLIPVKYKALSSESHGLATLTAVDFMDTLNKEWCWERIIKGIKGNPNT